MANIFRFSLEGKNNHLITDNLHPTFSFVVDFDKAMIIIQKIIIEMNGHKVDVTNTTFYQYEFDDLEPLNTYRAILKVYSDKGEESKELTFETGLGQWDAPFITDKLYVFKEKRVSPKVMSFKKTFVLDENVESAKAFITCFGVYNLYLNNKKINSEYLLPGFTSYKHQLQYQVFDLLTYLNSQNEIIVDVAGGWAVGSYVMNRANRISENKQSLSAIILVKYKDGRSELIKTDETWQVTTDTPYLFADLYDGEGFDASKERSNFHYASIYKTKCRPCILADYGAPIVVKKVMTPQFSHKIGEKYIFDLKQNAAGVVSLTIKNGKQGQVVKIQHAEILNKDKTLNTACLRSAKCEIKYICKDGEQKYSPTFTYMGFRYFSVEGVNIDDLDVEVLVLSSDLEEIGSFSCDNELINRLNQNIYWSSISNFMDIPTDCPQRDERMGWTGDIAVFAPTALFNFEMSAFLNKWLKDLRSEQLKTGGIPNTIPNQGYGFPITMPKMAIDFWGDAVILVPLALYNATGNLAFLKDNYESMKKYVKACIFWANLLSFGNHRYIWHTPSMLHFGDWVAPDVTKMSAWQKRSIYTATCSLKNTSHLLSEIAHKLSKEEDAKYFELVSRKVAKAFNEVLTNKNGILKKEFQTGYVLPIYFDMFEGTAKENALMRLVKIIKDNEYKIGTGFPGTPYILFALSENGYSDVAYKMLLNEKCPSWLYEVKTGGTTIWEKWDGLDESGECNINEDGTGGMISYNHYASGAVGNFLYTSLAGIQLLEPGYRRFKINPCYSQDIHYVKASTLTPYGRIEVEYIKQDKLKIKVRVPLRTECELYLPEGKIEHLLPGLHEYKA